MNDTHRLSTLRRPASLASAVLLTVFTWGGAPGTAAVPPDWDQVCSQTECRDEVPLEVRTGPRMHYKGTWPRRPYFYRGWGGIASGEMLSYEASVDANGQLSLHHVPQPSAESIDFDLSQPEDSPDSLTSMLSIYNKSRYAIVYSAMIYFLHDGSVEHMSTSVCALRPHLTTFEIWPYGVLFFEFGDLKSVPASEAESCQ